MVKRRLNMAESIADKILDVIGKISLVKPDKPLSEMVRGKPGEEKEDLTSYRGFQDRNKEQFTRGGAKGIWDTIAQWFGKSAPYTRPTGPGRDDPDQTYPTRAGYKY